ncbi:MAG TPA: hypothetical protein VKE53_02265 [Pseudolabrys sp.]|nr:hypothetical protein [Pseudolabrys sp.]
MSALPYYDIHHIVADEIIGRGTGSAGLILAALSSTDHVATSYTA